MIEQRYRFEHVWAVLEEYGAAVRNAYQDRLIRADKIATGELLNTVEYRVVQGDTSIDVQLDLKPYWQNVEDGRDPGVRPPISAILRWVKDKPVLPRPKDGIKPTPQSLAFLIARSIGERGIEPTHALHDTLKEERDRWEQRIIEAANQDLGDIIYQMFFAEMADIKRIY